MFRKDYKVAKIIAVKKKPYYTKYYCNIVNESLKRYRVNHKQCREKP